MQKDSPENIAEELRFESRSTDLSTHRAEIKFVGRPIYQFKVRDLSPSGAGILIKGDSNFLNMIEVDQIIDINFISSEGADPSGMHRAEIKHITGLDDGRLRGHQLVGISFLERLHQT